MIPDDALGGLRERVFARLSARLDGPGAHPVAVGLSGGGDSLALLALTCEWAQYSGRRVMALTVDHRLNPQSANWTQAAGEIAEQMGADWRGLSWTEASGGSAVQERARLARHALLANAARDAGASILLLGHTADDAAENRWMREAGTPVGTIREISPSPVWPQGRGVTVLRPLLSERRERLRDWLRARGLNWLDDPANDDPRYARVRARKAMAETAPNAARAETSILLDPGPLADEGVFEFSREALARSGRSLATALLCAAGTSVPPRGERLSALMGHITAGEPQVAVLAGARVEIEADRVCIFREAGEQRRSGLFPLSLSAGETAIWDGRFELMAREEGWQVLSAHGNLSRLTDHDRSRLAALPSAARLSFPILRNALTGRHLLRSSKVRIQALCGRRYRAAALCLADETTQEANLFDLWHGETGPTALFSS